MNSKFSSFSAIKSREGKVPDPDGTVGQVVRNMHYNKIPKHETQNMWGSELLNLGISCIR